METSEIIQAVRSARRFASAGNHGAASHELEQLIVDLQREVTLEEFDGIRQELVEGRPVRTLLIDLAARLEPF